MSLFLFRKYTLMKHVALLMNVGIYLASPSDIVDIYIVFRNPTRPDPILDPT